MIRGVVTGSYRVRDIDDPSPARELCGALTG